MPRSTRSPTRPSATTRAVTTPAPRPGSRPPQEAAAIVAACQDQIGEITKLDKTERKERAPLLYDLTSLQRDANRRFGFSARRTLGAAQRLYEEHKALTYPRTNSRYITGDMVGEIKQIAELVGKQKEYADGAKYVRGLDVLPLGRVVNDAKVTDHHAIIPTNADSHPVDKFNDDDKRIYDLVVRTFLAIFHPEAVFENTRIETTVATHVFRTRGKLLLVPGWRGVWGETADLDDTAGQDEDEGREQRLPRLDQGEAANVREVSSEEKETKPPQRYSEGRLLGAMETAGKLVDDEAMREAMKDSGIGTPATRAAIIERLLQVGYIERDARALVVTEKGLNVIRLLGEHPLTSPDLTGDWESRLGKIETGADYPQGVHGRHRQVRREHRRGARRQTEGRPHPARQPRAVPGVLAGHRREPQGLLVLVARGSRLRLRDLEVQGRQAAAAGRRPRADQDRPHRAPGDRLQGPLGQELPRPPGADADRRGPLARRVRRALGPRGRQAPRRRRAGRRRGGRAAAAEAAPAAVGAPAEEPAAA